MLRDNWSLMCKLADLRLEIGHHALELFADEACYDADVLHDKLHAVDVVKKRRGVAQVFDTPRGLKPDGFSHEPTERMVPCIQAAYGTKGLPGPTGRGIHREAALQHKALAQADGTRSNCALAFTQASGLAWNP